MSKEQPAAAIELVGVEKRFGRQTVLRDVNLSVASGKTTVIVGASGEGKSVIIKHMLGLVRPERGEVLVFGSNLARARKKELNRIRMEFGVLFQNVALFDSMSVFDNVALPLRERTKLSETVIRAKVREKLDLMDLIDADDKFPAQLSGGMKKRVGLARALMLDPKVVFFDEPTTGLDVSRSNEIYRLFHKTQRQLGYTAVIVSHDVPKIFKLADYVALLAEGKIQGVMSPEAFQLSEQPLIRRYVEETMGPIYSSAKEESALYEPA
ncbi:ABC transporter ATP-binding protein [Trichloromonas sp.]|uniref:ABC transporter ATP-binding protein n=1 Tax=Trichloromonas sp. TaxID=3069249 RepID=UPI002A412A07|nr:ATP-binding cassette domain-containing protein [Trichloromonas sp.]